MLTKREHQNIILHPDFEESIDRIKFDYSTVLIIRHSTRYTIPQGSRGKEIQLTREGILMARKFGGILKNKIKGVFSSPVERCFHTGLEILKGAELDQQVVICNSLGEPGSFIKNEELASHWLLKESPIKMVNHQINGHEIKGVYPIKTGINFLLSELFSKDFSQEKLNIFITHDTVLTCLVFYLIQRKATLENWPWMLEGAFLQLKDDHLLLTWRNKQFFINKDQFKIKINGKK